MCSIQQLLTQQTWLQRSHSNTASALLTLLSTIENKDIEHSSANKKIHLSFLSLWQSLVIQYLPWFVVIISLCPKSGGELSVWLPPATEADRNTLVLACLYCLQIKLQINCCQLCKVNGFHLALLCINWSIWRKKYKYQYDLLVICKKKQTAVNLQSNPEDHRDATS